MMKCGLLGEKLKHSYSPAIHSTFGGYEYVLFEKQPDELEEFLKNGSWSGLNVTIPYKKTVVPFMSQISETAEKTGSINTIVKRADGSLYGDNTDVHGFEELVCHSGINVSGKKTLVLGNGGAAASVVFALKKAGAEVVVISRSGENNYTNLDRQRDASVIVNTTPLGMYPNVGMAAVDLRKFPSCEGVLDIVYNPARTAIILQAEELGIPCANGLYMLVSQAKKSSELFTGKKIPEETVLEVSRSLAAQMQNIVLTGDSKDLLRKIADRIGMKSGREVLVSEPDIASITENCKQSGKVVAVETKINAENYKALHQNGIIIDIRKGCLGTSGQIQADCTLDASEAAGNEAKIAEKILEEYKGKVII